MDFLGKLKDKKLMNTENGSIIESEAQTEDLGITALVLYSILFSYIYINAFINIKEHLDFL